MIANRAPLCVLLLLLAACTSGAASNGVRSPAPSSTVSQGADGGLFAAAACGLPQPFLKRIWNGYVPERSGEIQIVPKAPDFVGKWLSHSGPWGYVQRVPLFLYGPGHVPAGRSVTRPVTVADVAPTIARLIDLDFDAPDGTPMREALGEETGKLPRLVVVAVWDAVGMNVLREYPDAWPTLRSLVERGVWFENATVGSSPSVTPSVHATLGTGAFPRSHGLVDLRFRVGDELLSSRAVGPEQLLVPTLGDTYDAAMAGRPRIGLVASGGTLMMMGRGSKVAGVSPHLAAAEFKGTFGPGVNRDFYRYPTYIDDITGPERDARAIDGLDGQIDGAWMGEHLLDDREGLSLTPAFPDYQTRILREVIRQEGFGEDEVPDLLFTNYKQTDHASHRWSMNSPQMEALLEATDRALADLVEFLDAEVGEGEWAMVVTSDHGSTPDPTTTGAFVIDNQQLVVDLRAEFDPEEAERSIVQDLRVTHIWLDHEAMRDAGMSEEDVATFLAGYTKGQNAPDPADLSAGEADEPVFEAVFPSAVLEHAPCMEKVKETGAG